jgi:hypothetical protein
LAIGIGAPVAAVAVCAALAAGLALPFAGDPGALSVAAAAGLGALFGLLASFYGIAELLVAFFFASGPALNRLCRAGGYVVFWTTAAALFLWLR